jgi:hypothetical protein
MSYVARLLVVALVPLLGGCSSTYYGMWERLGYEKRDILVEKVEDARDAQTEAKDEFKTTLERFQEVATFEGGELEAKYRSLKASYDDCAARAGQVSGRIESVEDVASDLFEEWQGEIDQITSADLRSKNGKLLADTRTRYDELIAAMKRSEAKMQPVLTRFNDQVLFLKGNLNAQAIASLDGTSIEIESDVADLIRDMEAAVAEADDFIRSMGSKS